MHGKLVLFFDFGRKMSWHCGQSLVPTHIAPTEGHLHAFLVGCVAARAKEVARAEEAVRCANLVKIRMEGLWRHDDPTPVELDSSTRTDSMLRDESAGRTNVPCQDACRAPA